MSRRFFGTDGIRGRVGQAPITADFVLKLGWAAGKVLGNSGSGRNVFLIGKDTRVSGYMFESALEAGLIAAGAEVGLLGPMPTPAIAYLTRTFQARAGIVISASHNPHYDNGIKFFSSEGFKLPDEIELEIEACLDAPFSTEDSENLGRAFRVEDAAGRYIEFCKSSVPRGFNLDGLNLVLDCSHGATYHIAPQVFRELGAKVTKIGAEPDGFNINRECGSTHPEKLREMVKEAEADMGIAFDGDGDRVLFIDRNGDLVDGDELLFIISEHMNRNGDLQGVVGTLMSNYGLEQAFREREIPFHRAKVGDRYVVEAMQNKGWSIGGESSGHLICGDLASTGDGIVAALQVLVALKQASVTLAEARRGMNKLPQTLINVEVAQVEDPTGNPSVADAVSAAEKRLDGGGRVLLRASGTEPLIRVMVEGEDNQLVSEVAEDIASVVRREMGR